MTTPKPLTLTRLPAAQLQLSRLLCNREISFAAAINGKTTEFELCTEVSDALPAYTIHLELNGQPYLVLASGLIIDQVLPKKLNHQALIKLPGDLRIATLNHFMMPVLQPLATQLGISCSVQDLKPSRANNAPDSVGMNITLNGVNSRIELQLNELLLAIISAIPTHHPSQLPDIPFWATLETGRTQLSTPELQSLETGDIVFLDEYVKNQQVILRINERTAFLGESSGTQVSILQRHQSMDRQTENLDDYDVNNHETEDGDQDQSGVDMANIPVNLVFEVGQQQLTLAELQNMKAGYIFELDSPIQQPVAIRANGKLIGHCELVQIENRLGARITQLHSS